MEGLKLVECLSRLKEDVVFTWLVNINLNHILLKEISIK